jgi:lipopolysaccharide biosynthesis glycosyltransferase
MKVCIGIVCIGRTYLEEFEKLFKPSVVEYCNKYRYDLKIFTDFLDPKNKHADTISFQKCLVPNQLLEYDRVVVLDADIFIESHAPPLHVIDLGDKIGFVNEVAQSTPEQYESLVSMGFADHPKEYYRKAGFDIESNSILNTGVIICQPLKHADYLKSIYEKHADKSVGHPRGFHYEQGCIGYEIQKDNMFTILPNAWNYIYIHPKLLSLKISTPHAFFVHFAGLRGSNREAALATHTYKGLLRWGIKK